jgi:hypothetical protein
MNAGFFSQKLLFSILLTALFSAAGAALPADVFSGMLEFSEPAPETLRVTGMGLPPAGVTNPTIRREMAERAALSDAERKLVQSIAEFKTGSETVRSRMGAGTFTRRIEGFIQGYRVVDRRERDHGGIDLDIELELTGQNALSRILIE